MKKSLLVLGACLLMVTVFQAFTISPQPRFTNLQILPKNISGDGLDSVMHHFTAALGVRCNYCHVRNDDTRKMDFASDAKPEKQIARKMMLMAIDINKNHFQQMENEFDKDHAGTATDTVAVNYMLKYVTCYTCHRGDPHPENKPPKREPNQQQPPMPPAPPQGSGSNNN